MHDPPTVYVTRQVPKSGLEPLEARCRVVVWEGSDPPPHDHLVEQLRTLDAEGLFCNVSDAVNEAVLDASPDLRSVATMSVGYDHIDFEAAVERGIAVGHTPGVLSETTADLAWALLMAAARRVVEADGSVRAGDWDYWGPMTLLGRDVHDATLGVVGLGGIGSAVARRAVGFDMDVLYTHTSPSPGGEAALAEYGIDATYHELPALLSRSDFVSVHVPLLEETVGMFGEEEFRTMDDEAILVNTARGEIVDTDALDTALEEGWIRHAALDVTDPEPLPPDHPLARHAPETLTLTPHIGSASMETRSTMAELTAENLLAGLDGDVPRHSALADAGYE